MLKDFTGSTTNIYDSKNNFLFETTVKKHDKNENYISLANFPDELITKDTCKVVILTSPAPLVYKGMFRKGPYEDTIITLFKGETACNRVEPRYDVNLNAEVEFVRKRRSKGEDLSESKVTAKAVNISKHGIRLRSKPHNLAIGDKIKIQILGQNDKKEVVMTADVLNQFDNPPEYTEVGCQFVTVEE